MCNVTDVIVYGLCSGRSGQSGVAALGLWHSQLHSKNRRLGLQRLFVTDCCIEKTHAISVIQFYKTFSKNKFLPEIAHGALVPSVDRNRRPWLYCTEVRPHCDMKQQCSNSKLTKTGMIWGRLMRACRTLWNMSTSCSTFSRSST